MFNFQLPHLDVPPALNEWASSMNIPPLPQLGLLEFGKHGPIYYTQNEIQNLRLLNNSDNLLLELNT